jgi:hypothetical protein
MKIYIYLLLALVSSAFAEEPPLRYNWPDIILTDYLEQEVPEYTNYPPHELGYASTNPAPPVRDEVWIGPTVNDRDWIENTLWARTNDPATMVRLNNMIAEIERPPLVPYGLEIGAGSLFVIPGGTNDVGYAVFVDDEGSLFTVEVHASPWLSQTQIMAEANAKIAANSASATNSTVRGDQARSEASSATTLPELSQAVDLMQDQIDELQRILNIRQ